MNLAKKLGCIGFIIGFIGPAVFYTSPVSFPTFGSHFVCPWCPIADWAFPTRWTWVNTALRFGVSSGLLLALTGLAIGYTASRISRK